MPETSCHPKILYILVHVHAALKLGGSSPGANYVLYDFSESLYGIVIGMLSV